MKKLKALAVLAVLAAPVAAPMTAMAGVDVTFTAPEKFTDASPRGNKNARETQRAMDQLSQYMTKQATRYLKPGQDLKIEVLDIDLAGRVEWWRTIFYDVRLMRDIDSPAIKLRYSLSENGTTLASGEEWMRDLGYLMGINVTLGSQDSLKYEKAMIGTWMRNRLAKFGATAG